MYTSTSKQIIFLFPNQLGHVIIKKKQKQKPNKIKQKKIQKTKNKKSTKGQKKTDLPEMTRR